MNAIFSFFAGLLFGIGLLLSGMSNPAKVLSFLDLAGKWDPSLAFVMLGGIAIAAFGFGYAKRRRVSLLNLPFNFPQASGIDRRLVIGSAIFGVGWGLTGICPGPALVMVGAGSEKAAIFVGSMLIGMMIFEYILPQKQ